MSGVARAQHSMRFRSRSYLACVLTPEPPIAEWLTELDGWIAASAGYFAGRPVVVNLSAVRLSGAGIAHLVSELAERDIRIMGIEGTEQADLPSALPPLLQGGRPVEPVISSRSGPAQPSRPETASLMLDSPVRSGQSVFFPDGDVTVLGAIASGAEVVAGGSIHVYGVLRGRALAGTNGYARARIFCRRIEAELLAIDGYYRTADELDPGLRGRPAQAWLEGQTLTIAALD